MPKPRLTGSMILAALSAFCVYTFMFAYRKPFTAASFDTAPFLGIDYKVWLVIAQTLGYTLAKFYGIKAIAELQSKKRALLIIGFILLAWLSLLLFALVPAPYNIVLFVLNGFPLGMIYGLVFSYLEGRRATEFLGAVLATSFIFAAGFTQSAGKYIMQEWQVNQWWMPFITGAVFLLPLVIATWLLNKTPDPTDEDRLLRTERKPMNKEERMGFIKRFLPGLVLLIAAYVLLTIMRDYRSNFAANIWNELDKGSDVSIFTRTELPASVVILVLMSSLIFIRTNIKALYINHIIVVFGFILCMAVTALYSNQMLSPYWWMTIVGIGLYLGYVPFNAILFDRLIGSFQHVSNAGFLIYLADSFGYIGSDLVLIVKNFTNVSISWSQFFITLIYLLCSIGLVFMLLALGYFHRKYKSFKSLQTQ